MLGMKEQLGNPDIGLLCSSWDAAAAAATAATTTTTTTTVLKVRCPVGLITARR